MTWRRTAIYSHDQAKARLTRLREQGFDDGYAGVAARCLDSEYQRAWKRGREARANDRTA